MNSASTALVMMGLFWLSGCGASSKDDAASGSAAPITEAQLLDYATVPFDKNLFMRPPIALGSLNGVDVIAEHICSDICPDYTVRIIHFVLPENVTCTSVDGIEKSMNVPAGIGSYRREFCFPHVLVSNWDRYVRE